MSKLTDEELSTGMRGKALHLKRALASFFYSSFFFRSCSRQEIVLSALIGQFRVSNLRRVAFIFHWPIVHRLHNALSITRSPISKQSTPLNTSPASKRNLPLFHPKFVSKCLHCFLKSAPSVQL